MSKMLIDVYHEMIKKNKKSIDGELSELDTPVSFVKILDGKYKYRRTFNEFVSQLLLMEKRIEVIPFPAGMSSLAYIVSKDKLIFATEIPTIEHEIAHMVEIQDYSRCVMNDWGFSPNIHSMNKPSLFRALTREIRVRSIECIIRDLDFNGKYQDSATNIFINNSWKKEFEFPFMRFANFNELMDWQRHIQETTTKNWSLERIREEWKLRLDYIRNWMEIKTKAD